MGITSCGYSQKLVCRVCRRASNQACRIQVRSVSGQKIGFYTFPSQNGSNKNFRYFFNYFKITNFLLFLFVNLKFKLRPDWSNPFGHKFETFYIYLLTRPCRPDFQPWFVVIRVIYIKFWIWVFFWIQVRVKPEYLNSFRWI